MLMMTMATKRVKTGTQMPTRYGQPAIDRAKTSKGMRRKQMRRYKTANHLYLAVMFPKALAKRMGRRMKGTGYQRRIPEILKKKWHRAI